MAARWLSTLWVAVAVVASCAPAAPHTSALPEESSQRAPAAQINATATPSTEAPAAAKRAPLAIVTEPAVLAALEKRGFSLGEVLTGSRRDSAAALEQHESYASLVKILKNDLAAIGYRDRLSGVGLTHAHRLFDAGWLISDKARFELVGVVNRLDRQPFEPAHCGEIRFVYRLAYDVTVDSVRVQSRLPLTVNVVAWQPAPEGGSCAKALKRWVAPDERSGEALASWLASKDGPLPDQRPFAALKSVEVNLQSVRWPATVHTTMAGHAEYLLRVFHRAGVQLAPGLLENQVDVAQLKQKPALKAELLAWLKEPSQLAALDAGTLRVPDRFLASEARSVAPRGLARRANRPYRQLFSPKDFSDVDWSGRRFTRSAEEALRRLDGLSCSGCHQSRSVAGFHLLGHERRSDKQVDALAIASSPHLEDELRLRAAAYGTQRPAERRRPLPERDPALVGGWGAHCALGSEHFADWSCGQGLRCEPALGEPFLGVCQEGVPGVGAACETGQVTVKDNPHADRVTAVKRSACAAGVCEKNAVGFPGGMCSSACDPKDTAGTCGGIAILVDFNDCLARRRPFERCILENTRPANLRACSDSQPCRDDYVCARTPSGAGGCIPPYFLFQLRVDGHPRPY